MAISAEVVRTVLGDGYVTIEYAEPARDFGQRLDRVFAGVQQAEPSGT
jgi:hypothetical protein